MPLAPMVANPPIIDPTDVVSVIVVTPPTLEILTSCPSKGVAGKAIVSVVAIEASWIKRILVPVSAIVIVPLFAVEYWIY